MSSWTDEPKDWLGWIILIVIVLIAVFNFSEYWRERHSIASRALKPPLVKSDRLQLYVRPKDCIDDFFESNGYLSRERTENESVVRNCIQQMIKERLAEAESEFQENIWDNSYFESRW